jgi:transcription elongation factor GreA
MSNAHELSQAAHDRLVAELEQLRTHGRIDLADRIERAREHGDLKENAEYHAAKEEKAKMEARIAKLFGILENAVIVEGGTGGDTVVAGSILLLRYSDDDEDEAERYLVGSIEERHDDLHVVSPQSPMGEALLGAKVGDTVSYRAPTGELQVVVMSIE